VSGTERAHRSIRQCVDAVLADYTARDSIFASPPQAEEVEQLEYQLARALNELRAIQRRVDRLVGELEQKRDARERVARN